VRRWDHPIIFGTGKRLKKGKTCWTVVAHDRLVAAGWTTHHRMINRWHYDKTGNKTNSWQACIQQRCNFNKSLTTNCGQPYHKLKKNIQLLYDNNTGYLTWHHPCKKKHDETKKNFLRNRHWTINTQWTKMALVYTTGIHLILSI